MSGAHPPCSQVRNPSLLPIAVYAGSTWRWIGPCACSPVPHATLAGLGQELAAGALVLPPTARPPYVPAWERDALRPKLAKPPSLAALRRLAPGDAEARQLLAAMRGTAIGVERWSAANATVRNPHLAERKRPGPKPKDPADDAAAVMAFLRGCGTQGVTLWAIHRSLSRFAGGELRRILAALAAQGRARVGPRARKSRNGPIPQVWFALD
jgi:hypothetical protein